MGTYIALMNFTDQGIRNVKDSTKRADAVKEAAMRNRQCVSGQVGLRISDLLDGDGQPDQVVAAQGDMVELASEVPLCRLRS